MHFYVFELVQKALLSSYHQACEKGFSPKKTKGVLSALFKYSWFFICFCFFAVLASAINLFKIIRLCIFGVCVCVMCVNDLFVSIHVRLSENAPLSILTGNIIAWHVSCMTGWL